MTYLSTNLFNSADFLWIHFNAHFGFDIPSIHLQKIFYENYLYIFENWIEKWSLNLYFLISLKNRKKLQVHITLQYTSNTTVIAFEIKPLNYIKEPYFKFRFYFISRKSLHKIFLLCCEETTYPFAFHS